MTKSVGTISMGVRTPIIRQGDNLAAIVVDSVASAVNEMGMRFENRDVIGITEAIVARAQGNYISVDAIAKDVKAKFNGADTVGVVSPILSRNRFAICLRGIARGVKKVVLMLSYPSDEVGNHLFDPALIDQTNIDPYHNVLSLSEYREAFGSATHVFTGVDYVDYYKQLIEAEGAEAEVIFANHAEAILPYTKNVLCCDIHSRMRSKMLLQKAGAACVRTMDEIANAPVDGSGYNADYGLLGSNKATEEMVKLFPRDAKAFSEQVAAILKDKTGKNIEVLVYGDGAFKDPVGKIWELADPVVSPGHTDGLIGTPNELKLKYLADNDFAELSGDDLKAAIEGEIRKKDGDLTGNMASEGTTPRRLTDLIGSLCDLTSGSGDKGTPVIYIKNYFKNYAD